MAYICGSLSHEVGFLFRRTVYPTVNVQKKREPSNGKQRKKAEVRFTAALIVENRNGQAGFRPFLLPSLEDILHRCIQRSLHTFLHHLKNKRLYHSFLLLLALLLILLFLTHFTLTTLLNVRLGITNSGSDSFASLLAFLRSIKSLYIYLRFAYMICSGV